MSVTKARLRKLEQKAAAKGKGAVDPERWTPMSEQDISDLFGRYEHDPRCTADPRGAPAGASTETPWRRPRRPATPSTRRKGMRRK